MGDRINDTALWQQELFRQVHSVKGALRSLQLQAGHLRDKYKGRKSLAEMEHTFACVDAAFAELNKQKPRSDSGLIRGPKGRREFLSDLKHGEVRT